MSGSIFTENKNKRKFKNPTILVNEKNLRILKKDFLSSKDLSILVPIASKLTEREKIKLIFDITKIRQPLPTPSAQCLKDQSPVDQVTQAKNQNSESVELTVTLSLFVAILQTVSSGRVYSNINGSVTCWRIRTELTIEKQYLAD